MKILRNLTLFSLLAAFVTLYSCGEDGGTDVKSDQELTIEALSGTWNVNSSSSQFGTGLPDDAITSVTITSTGFSLVGDITQVVDGGSFTVSEEGALTSPSVNITSADVEVDGDVTVSLNAAKTKLTVSFTTVAKDARVSGTGSFVIVLDKAS